jgi:CRP-like cAMP-binding protein
MKNQLLLRLDEDARTLIEASLESVPFQRGTILCEAGDILQHVYFPETCVLSLLTVLVDGTQIETATIGQEGSFGALASMGSNLAYSRCMVQFGGLASRIDVRKMRSELERSADAREVFIRYAEATVFQIQQSAACNALHPVEARLSRWLLEMSDRSGTNRLPLTHEFLAEFLGANRTTVSLAAAALQSAELISYQRGFIDIQDRRGLEGAACECYASVREQTERIWLDNK